MNTESDEHMMSVNQETDVCDYIYCTDPQKNQLLQLFTTSDERPLYSCLVANWIVAAG